MADLKEIAESNRPKPGRKTSKPKLVKTLQEVSLALPLADEVVYQHALLCQVALPASDPKANRYWSVENGRSSLIIQAGIVKDQRTKKLIEVGLPYGVTARLLFINLVSEILKNKKKYQQTGERIISLEKSMSAFIKRLGLPVTKHYINNVKEQILRMSRAQFTFIVTAEGVPHDGYSDIKLFDKHDLWYPESADQLGFWPSFVEPTAKFTEFVINHAVPLDERAVASLSEGTLTLDIYAWLAHRLCRVNKETPEFVDWKSLYEIYGKGYAKTNKFKEKFREALHKVLHAYPRAANSVTEGICVVKNGNKQSGRYSGFWLEYTPPPVPHSSDYKPQLEGKKKHVIDIKPVKGKRSRAQVEATVYRPPSEADILKMSREELDKLPKINKKKKK